VQAYEYVGKNLTGMYTMELMVATPGGWLNPEYWPALEELKAFLLESDLVARVVTPLDFLRKVNQWEHDLDPAFYTLPTTREEALALWDPLGDTEKEEIKRLVRADGEEIRISALIASTEAARFGELVDATRAHIAALPAPLTAEITGAVTRMQAMQRELVRTQVSSFALSFLFIFLCIYVGLRNWRMTLLSMPPNMFSILTVFAVMVVRGISLDAGTVMVASIALGITVDNTLHVITAYLRECREGAPTDVALRVTMVEAGIPMTLAIITAGIGFFALTASSFVPIVNFGLLCGVALCFALAADLLFTPALLAWAAPRQKL
jgi:predicted RND superfamily exporter protein